MNQAQEANRRFVRLGESLHNGEDEKEQAVKNRFHRKSRHGFWRDRSNHPAFVRRDGRTRKRLSGTPPTRRANHPISTVLGTDRSPTRGNFANARLKLRTPERKLPPPPHRSIGW